MRILIMDPHLDQAMAFARLIRQTAPAARVIGGYEAGRKPYLKLPYYHSLQECRFEDPGLEDQFDVVIPTGADSTVKRVSGKGRIRLGEVIFDEANLRANNKPAILTLARECGVPIPETWENPALIRQYPIFFKDAREDNRPQRLRGIAESPTALEKRCGASPGLIYQELIDTPHTFGVAFLASNGELHTHFIHRELCSFPVSGGSGVILQRHSAPRLLDLTQNLLDKLGYNGWGLMEFKWCSRRKDFVFMELNAKFWESAAFAFLNQPAFLKHLLGINYPGQAIDKAVYLKRFFLLPLKTQLAMLGKLPGCRLLGTEHLKGYVAGHLLPERIKTGVKRLSGMAKNLAGQE